MNPVNSSHFNVCNFTGKLLLSLIFCLTAACTALNDAKYTFSTENQNQISENAVNINNAAASELEKLPQIGEKTAQEIIRHREKFGRFRKPEHLLMIRGISDKQFREMKNLIRVE